ncbi:MAG: RagB/SusD family nutrient uptake outer membrane protein [Cytophagales bacterium]|nr:RagB/SusD family nutrient uptake outer membrane protein [Cytophagales bacterium]
MKLSKSFITTVLSVILLALSSCERVLEVEPEFNKDGSQIFTNLKDYEFALTGAYAAFRQVGYFGNGGQTSGTWGTLPDMMSDNIVQTGEDLANFQNQTNWEYTADEADIDLAWSSAYYVIGQANLVLRNIDRFTTEDAKKVNRLKGQALAIRGMVHFDLLRFWGESYERNSTAKGIPYKTSVDAEDLPSRLSVKETWDAIFKDMQEAETLLGDVDAAINSNTNKTKLDRNAVRALLARMHLYAKNYAEAETFATQVITAVPLASKTAFPEIWKDGSVAEVLWAVSFNPGEGTPSANIHAASTNRNRYRPSAPLEALYDKTNDIRYPAYIGTRVLSGNTRKIVNKHLGKGTALDNIVNWKALRTGEMYLIRAEARALQTGKESDALADLNALRAARIKEYTDVTLAGQALLDAIADERRRELFVEGHRWFDVKRTTKTIVRTDVALQSTVDSIGSTAREWNWPIPTSELDANANLKPQQTTGY